MGIWMLIHWTWLSSSRPSSRKHIWKIMFTTNINYYKINYLELRLVWLKVRTYFWYYFQRRIITRTCSSNIILNSSNSNNNPNFNNNKIILIQILINSLVSSNNNNSNFKPSFNSTNNLYYSKIVFWMKRIYSYKIYWFWMNCSF
jgi:hypothetical protein